MHFKNYTKALTKVYYPIFFCLFSKKVQVTDEIIGMGVIMKQFRIGIIGLGNISRRHIPAYKQIAEVEVVAASEIARDRLNQVCDEYGITRRYLGYEDMLKKEKLDIVSILTPHYLHKSMCEKAAEAGVNVLCEKAMATSVEDAKAMIDVCDRNGVKLMYSENFRFMPACENAKKLIDDGILGKIIFVNENSHGGSLARLVQAKKEGKLPWRLIKKFSGGGGLIDHGIHAVDICRWLAGSDVESVYGKIRSVSGLDVEDFAQLIMNFRNGTQGYVETSNICKNYGEETCVFRVYGEEASLRLFPRENTMFVLKDTLWEPIKLPDVGEVYTYAMKRVMESFVKSVMNNEPLEVPGIEGLKDLEIVLAAYESGKKSAEIRLSRTHS